MAISPELDRQERAGKYFLVALGVYFLIQVAIRVAQQGALELDEAEQVFIAQHLRLGYNTQPPLYAWLQWLAFQVFGVSHLGLAVLKNALLFLLYASLFQTARLLLGTLPGIAVAASLVLLIPFGWEAQVDRTHTILATALAAATLWAYFALLRHPTRRLRLVLGLLIGLGMQSKYNFAIFVLALCGASFIVREHRVVVWTKDMWLTVQVAVLTLLPHAMWFFQQAGTASTTTLQKMGGAPGSGYARNVINGLFEFFVSVVAFLAPFWLVLGVLFWRRRQASAQPGLDARFFLWFYATGAACITALVLSGYLANIRSRWLQPLLFSLPLAFCLFFPPRLAKHYRQLLFVSVLGASVLTVALALRPQIQVALGKDARIYQPYPELAAEIAHRFPAARAVAAQDLHVAGNIRFQLDHVAAVLTEDMCAALPGLEGKLLVLVQSESEAAGRGLGKACPYTVVVEEGQIDAYSLNYPRQQLSFDYALVRRERRQTWATANQAPEDRSNDL
jgi:4-amino-4-deoxy-L-arabinose transferase-like glycosyltransferase